MFILFTIRILFKCPFGFGLFLVNNLLYVWYIISIFFLFLFTYGAISFIGLLTCLFSLLAFYSFAHSWGSKNFCKAVDVVAKILRIRLLGPSVLPSRTLRAHRVFKGRQPYSVA